MTRTVLDWLLEKYPTAKRQTLRRMVQAGRIGVNGRPARRLDQPIAEGDTLAADERPILVQKPKRSLGLNILHEDDDILVVDKPAGLLTSTVPREPRPTLLAMVREHLERTQPRARLGLIHRLDRDASGLLVFSKTDAAYQSLKTQFYKHAVERVYLAAVHGVPRPPKGRIESRLVERADGTVYTTRQYGKGEQAVTDYEVVRPDKQCALVRVALQTGRKHQIRVHLKEHGTPIIGDAVYGRENDDADRLMLAAIRLGITHPKTGEKIVFDIPTPKDFPVSD